MVASVHTDTLLSQNLDFLLLLVKHQAYGLARGHSQSSCNQLSVCSSLLLCACYGIIHYNYLTVVGGTLLTSHPNLSVPRYFCFFNVGRIDNKLFTTDKQVYTFTPPKRSNTHLGSRGLVKPNSQLKKMLEYLKYIHRRFLLENLHYLWFHKIPFICRWYTKFIMREQFIKFHIYREILDCL